MPEKNIAILIDAENIDPTFAGQIFSYANSIGTPIVREIFGAGIALNEWVEPIMEYDIIPHITLKPNRYKNSSDISLVLGAADVLINNIKHPETACDTVIIVSSDCDFSPVATRLRREGLKVIGMGEIKNVNPIWPKACTEFVGLEPQGPLMRKWDEGESTTVVQLELVEEKEEPSDEEAPAPVIKPAINPSQVAPSHQMRVENIRDFIREKIDDYGGKIRSAELLRELSFLADYRFDQRRSNRTPLMYLQSFYSSWFNIEPGEKGAFTVSNYDPLAPVRVWHSEPNLPVESSVTTSEPEDNVTLQEEEGTMPEDANTDTDEAGTELPEPADNSMDNMFPSDDDASADDDTLTEIHLEDVAVPISTPLSKAGFPRNTVKSLTELGFRTVEDLLNASENDLSHFNNLSGKKRKRLLRLQKTLRDKLATSPTELTTDSSSMANESETTEPTETAAAEPSIRIETEVAEPSALEETETAGPDALAETEEVDTQIEIREVTPPRLAPLDTLLEKGGVPHRAAMTLRKYGVKNLRDLVNLTEEDINQFSGIPAQRREKILQLHSELKERYQAAPDTTTTSSFEETDKIADEPEGDLFRYLSDHGVPLSRVARILFIVGNSPNGRIIYNELRKVFGNEDANEYMRLLREFREQPSILQE